MRLSLPSAVAAIVLFGLMRAMPWPRRAAPRIGP